MAAGSLLTLLDDIATLMDDVSVMTKVAAKKTTGVLGDDLALNAQQVTGVRAERELPIVWAVCKGSLLNKLMLVPAALLISAFAPWLVTPLLMLGGAYLSYEGVEKLAHAWHKRQHPHTGKKDTASVERSAEEQTALEKKRIKGAVRTDFILSAEIIAITLGTVADAALMQQALVLSIIAVVMTLGVYGLVAAIVRLDDVGLYLCRRSAGVAQALGRGILRTAPWLMKFLSIAGTAAMFMVGGGILTHGIPVLHHAIETLTLAEGDIPGVGAILQPITPTLINMLVGLVLGALVLGAVSLARKMRGAH
ncbi:hypothetical protein GCM10010082_18480 [Kushneria pakistanensis]|uniref:DUF808 domain-containing protein n=1 Tax=Kushneria pakistanensis TaxID=1508770 RepID=A0ABQ3FIV1_9GAMM|nr:DUF808 domain-containing protein [Kushneria pakistanensis]GHC25791.1 hypothetical protein GCM10010082_18480 [Kushneria pakistanensis]